jgi:hypothetical protein
VNRPSLWLLAFALAASCPHALAQDTPEQRALQLERVLGSFASQARDGRVATGVMQGAAGVLTLTPGIVMVTRDDANLRALGTGFIVAGAINLLAVPALLFPTTVEALYAELHQPAADGGGRAALVAKVEADLQEAVRRQRFKRPIQAAAFFALGVPATAVGLTFLLAKPGLASMKPGAQRDWGALLTAIGVPYLSLGFLQLFQTSPEEAAWELYQSELTQPQPAAPRASLSLAPVIGGASANLSLSF